MSRVRRTGQRVQVYAVVRLDRFLGVDASLESRVTVKEVLPTLEDAEREVRRLNDAADDDGILYTIQATRYFPEGRKVAPAG